MRKNLRKFFLFIPATLVVLIMLFPDVGKSGAAKGIMLSANVIIPSLYPFMVCVMMLIKNGIYVKNKLVNKLLYVLLGHNFEMFFTFVLSLIGGYPVGAKMISELYNENVIDRKTANIMLMYCVNAGPAFVIMIVGGALGSYSFGKVLLISHIASSVVTAVFCGSYLRRDNCSYNLVKRPYKPFYHILTESISDAGESILNISCFVVFFSVINSFFENFFADMPILKYISYFTEVTSAVTHEKNIYFVSFLLAFCGLSIWCQIFTIIKSIKINVKLFILGRTIHGILSLLVTIIIFKSSKITAPTFSNNVSFSNKVLYSDVYLFISMLIMLIVLLIFIYSKNNSGKLLKDVV